MLYLKYLLTCRKIYQINSVGKLKIMKEFPTEVLIGVFIQLHLKDKIECLAVCKKWACVIKTSCLLHTIRITSTSQMKRIMKKVKADPFHANRVERLVFDLDAERNFNVIQFLNLFPNLLTIYMERSLQTQFPITGTRSKNSRIKRIYDIKGYDLACYFITSNKCSQLEELVVNGNTLGKNTLKNLIERFPCMPALTKLSLSCIDISLSKLELLHDALPSLKSLSIADMHLKHSELPDTIKPATSITIVCVQLGKRNNPTEIETEYFQYVRQKYSNLLEWSFTATYTRMINPDRFFNGTISPFIQSLASQLKKCVMNVNNLPQHIQDILNQINLNGSHPEIVFNHNNTTLKIAKTIQLSPMRYFTNISITYNAALDFKILKECIALEKLELSGNGSISPKKNPNLKLNDVLDACADTVKSLRIIYANVKFDAVDARVNDIKSLYFRNAYLGNGLDFFISHYLPSLDRLSIISTEFSEHKFFLQDTNLSYLHIEDPSHLIDLVWKKRTYMNLLVQTENEPEGRLWVIEKFTRLSSLFQYFNNEDSVCAHVKCIQQKKQRHFPTLTFKLASVKTVFIGGTSP